MRTIRLVMLLCFMVFLSTGCASDGSFVNPFDSTDNGGGAPANPYFFAEFPDVPIPNDVSEDSGKTFITFAPSGVKSGVQVFSGYGADSVSLMNSMRRNMAANGWTLRSLLRSKSSIMVFEKPDRICSVVVQEGVVSTTMLVFVSPRLEGDSSSLDISAFSQPAPSGGASGGVQKLNQ